MTSSTPFISDYGVCGRKEAFAKERTADDKEQATQARRMIGLVGRLRRGEQVFVSRTYTGTGFSYRIEFSRRRALKFMRQHPEAKMHRIARKQNTSRVFGRVFGCEPI